MSDPRESMGEESWKYWLARYEDCRRVAKERQRPVDIYDRVAATLERDWERFLREILWGRIDDDYWQRATRRA